MQSNDPDSKEEIRVYKHNQERRQFLIKKLWRQARNDDEAGVFRGVRAPERVAIHYKDLFFKD